MKSTLSSLISKALITFCALSSLADGSPKTTNPAQDYLSNFDLKWQHAPKQWDESAFVGNGRLGMTVRQDVSEGIRFELGDTTLFDNKSRIPIGRFILKPQGEITDFKMSQSLYLSEINGVIKTTQGAFSFNCFIDAETDLATIEFQSKGKEDVQLQLVNQPPIASNTLIPHNTT